MSTSIVTTAELALILKVSPYTVRRRVAQGILHPLNAPPRLLGKRGPEQRFELEAALEELSRPREETERERPAGIVLRNARI